VLIRLDIHLRRPGDAPDNDAVDVPIDRIGRFHRLPEATESGHLESVSEVSIFSSGFVLDRDLEQELLDLLGRLPALECVTIRTVADPASFSAEAAAALCARLAHFDVACGVDFSLDGAADALATLAGKPSSLTKILDCTRDAVAKGVAVRWLVPTLPSLIHRLEAIFSLARDAGVDPVLVPASCASAAGSDLDPDARQFLWDFVSYRLLDEERSLIPQRRLAFLETLREALLAPSESVPTRVVAARIERTRDLDPEAERGGDWLLGTHACPAESHAAESGLLSAEPTIAKPRGRSFERMLEIAGVLIEGLRALVQWGLAAAAGYPGVKKSLGDDVKLPSVLVIGAYGGEHIGDAAILGGVLLRMHERFATTRAILISQRPNHTRHLVPMLDLPVQIEVEGHAQSKIAGRMSEVDAVVFAGGPLMDIPKQLTKHFYAVALACRQGKPFIIEGVGAGPFLLRISEWMARRLVRLASSVSVRTSTDAEAAIMRGIPVRIGRDPAFDYLATRPAQLTRIPDGDRRFAERLFEDTDGRLLIGINLRPIRHIYTVSNAGSDGVDYTRAVVSGFEAAFARGLRRFHRSCARPPCFIFYTMNGIQFGSSDLRSAYRLEHLLGADVDFRVWEADPSLDAVVSVLRRMDAVVAMRFHGAIFALSQGRPVIGIDYRIGKNDKVHALLEDLGQAENCVRVDLFREEWLLGRLTALTSEAP
jgi:polysaccharide pyruvyl transferase WcaK-like protein